LVSSVVMEDAVIARQQEELKARQAEKTDPSILPMLRMEDIITPRRLQPVLVGVQSTSTKKYEQYHVKIEEDINFYRVVFSFEAVDAQFLSALALWETAVNRTISTHSHGYN
jgi:Zn-dependent M16 (insulinase) family peptidase